MRLARELMAKEQASEAAAAPKKKGPSLEERAALAKAAMSQNQGTKSASGSGQVGLAGG